MEPFKNRFSPALVEIIAAHLGAHLPGFDRAGFLHAILPRLPALELKARVALIADALHEALPADPATRAAVLAAMLHPDDLDHVDKASDADGICGWGIMPLTLVVARHGIADFARSMELLRQMTGRFTAEFDIRPFLVADQPRALAIIAGWVTDPNRHVRRLVSEGTRPRLPWGIRLAALVRDPSATLPLLAALRDDPEEYVRRSVANHLNDIAKDHPALVVDLARDWLRDAGPARRAMLRHACRGLVKQGHQGALALFGAAGAAVSVSRLTLNATRFAMEEVMEFSAVLRSTSQSPQTVIVDYVLHLLKANGMLAPKVFKGGVVTLEAGQEKLFRRAHRLREVTTRRHYPGRQAIALRVNGADTPAVEFTLLG